MNELPPVMTDEERAYLLPYAQRLAVLDVRANEYESAFSVRAWTRVDRVAYRLLKIEIERAEFVLQWAEKWWRSEEVRKARGGFYTKLRG